jgi:hypothetical protein
VIEASGPDYTHPVIVAVSDVDVALRIDVTAVWTVQAGGCRLAAIALTTLVTTSHCGHQTSSCIDAPDGMVFRIHH